MRGGAEGGVGVTEMTGHLLNNQVTAWPPSPLLRKAKLKVAPLELLFVIRFKCCLVGPKPNPKSVCLRSLTVSCRCRERPHQRADCPASEWTLSAAQPWLCQAEKKDKLGPVKCFLVSMQRPSMRLPFMDENNIS